MKLFQLNVTANWGSTGKIAEGIGLAAIERGWESAIAYGRYMNPSASKLIKVGNRWDVYAHYAKNRFLDGEGLGSVSATRHLIRQIDEYGPDIIHLHNIHDHWLNYPILFKYLASAKTPIVWTFHDCWAFTGGCAYFDKVGCRQWMTSCVKCPLKRACYDKCNRNYNLKKGLIDIIRPRLHIVPVSDWLAEYCVESFLSGIPTITIHNGIDIAKFSPSTDKRKIILGVALPWSERKGFDDMITLRSLVPIDYKIVLIGVSDKQLKQLPDGITGIKRTQDIETLVKYYSQATVLVNPTYEDNFPTVNLEALACGTPVITYQTGGSPEAIDSDTGIVIEKGNITNMANAIKDVIDGHNRYTSEQCRKRAIEHFDARMQFAKYIDLYDKILAKI